MDGEFEIVKSKKSIKKNKSLYKSTTNTMFLYATATVAYYYFDKQITMCGLDLCCELNSAKNNFLVFLGSDMQEALQVTPFDAAALEDFLELTIEADEQVALLRELTTELCCEIRHRPIVVDCVEFVPECCC